MMKIALILLCAVIIVAAASAAATIATTTKTTSTILLPPPSPPSKYTCHNSVPIALDGGIYSGGITIDSASGSSISCPVTIKNVTTKFVQFGDALGPGATVLIEGVHCTGGGLNYPQTYCVFFGSISSVEQIIIDSVTWSIGSANQGIEQASVLMFDGELSGSQIVVRRTNLLPDSIVVSGASHVAVSVVRVASMLGSELTVADCNVAGNFASSGAAGQVDVQVLYMTGVQEHGNRVLVLRNTLEGVFVQWRDASSASASFFIASLAMSAGHGAGTSITVAENIINNSLSSASILAVNAAHGSPPSLALINVTGNSIDGRNSSATSQAQSVVAALYIQVPSGAANLSVKTISVTANNMRNVWPDGSAVTSSILAVAQVSLTSQFLTVTENTVRSCVSGQIANMQSFYLHVSSLCEFQQNRVDDIPYVASSLKMLSGITLEVMSMHVASLGVVGLSVDWGAGTRAAPNAQGPQWFGGVSILVAGSSSSGIQLLEFVEIVDVHVRISEFGFRCSRTEFYAVYLDLPSIGGSVAPLIAVRNCALDVASLTPWENPAGEIEIQLTAVRIYEISSSSSSSGLGVAVTISGCSVGETSVLATGVLGTLRLVSTVVNAGLVSSLARLDVCANTLHPQRIASPAAGKELAYLHHIDATATIFLAANQLSGSVAGPKLVVANISNNAVLGLGVANAVCNLSSIVVNIFTSTGSMSLFKSFAASNNSIRNVSVTLAAPVIPAAVHVALFNFSTAAGGGFYFGSTLPKDTSLVLSGGVIDGVHIASLSEGTSPGGQEMHSLQVVGAMFGGIVSGIEALTVQTMRITDVVVRSSARTGGGLGNENILAGVVFNQSIKMSDESSSNKITLLSIVLNAVVTCRFPTAKIAVVKSIGGSGPSLEVDDCGLNVQARVPKKSQSPAGVQHDQIQSFILTLAPGAGGAPQAVTVGRCYISGSHTGGQSAAVVMLLLQPQNSAGGNPAPISTLNVVDNEIGANFQCASSQCAASIFTSAVATAPIFSYVKENRLRGSYFVNSDGAGFDLMLGIALVFQLGPGVAVFDVKDNQLNPAMARYQNTNKLRAKIRAFILATESSITGNGAGTSEMCIEDNALLGKYEVSQDGSICTALLLMNMTKSTISKFATVVNSPNFIDYSATGASAASPANIAGYSKESMDVFCGPRVFVSTTTTTVTASGGNSGTTTAAPAERSSSGGLSEAETIGLGLGLGVACVVVLLVVLFLLWRRRKEQRAAKNSAAHNETSSLLGAQQSLGGHSGSSSSSSSTFSGRGGGGGGGGVAPNTSAPSLNSQQNSSVQFSPSAAAAAAAVPAPVRALPVAVSSKPSLLQQSGRAGAASLEQGRKMFQRRIVAEEMLLEADAAQPGSPMAAGSPPTSDAAAAAAAAAASSPAPFPPGSLPAVLLESQVLRSHLEHLPRILSGAWTAATNIYDREQTDPDPDVTASLTLDEIFSIALYTFDLGTHPAEANFYFFFNKVALREKAAQVVKALHPYSSALQAAWAKLKPRSGVVFRGISVKGGVAVENLKKNDYAPGKTVTWQAVTSCSVDSAVAMAFQSQQNQQQQEGIMFQISAVDCRSVQRYSCIASESELLFWPNSGFIVLEQTIAKSNVAGARHVISLQQVSQSKTTVF